MYINELGVKEINQYYAQHGGRRTAVIKGFANYMENAKTGRISSAGSRIAAQTNSAIARAARQAASGITARTARQTASGTTTHAASNTQSETEGTGNSTAGASGSGGSCCDKCQLTQQLMLRMMTNNLYTQSGLGYSALGSGALTAYQSLAKYFGTGLFS